jgi:hypothetical protein
MKSLFHFPMIQYSYEMFSLDFKAFIESLIVNQGGTFIL